MKTTRTLAWTCLAATIGLAITSSALAADNLKLLVQVTQLKAQESDDEPPPPPPPPPKPIVVAEGTFTSNLNGYTGAIRLGFNQQLLPYIEQENLRGPILDTVVDKGGSLTFTAYDEVAQRFLVIDATPVAWSRTGEITKLRGDYQILRLDSRGTMRPVDQGIIAILIGL